MRVNHLSFVPMSGKQGELKSSTFDALIESGKAIEVTTLAGNYFPAGRVAIESTVYERHVAWNSQAMRLHGLYLEESNRLSDLLCAASMATRHESPPEFFHRVLSTDDNSMAAQRCSFVLQRFSEDVKTGWLIRQ